MADRKWVLLFAPCSRSWSEPTLGGDDGGGAENQRLFTGAGSVRQARQFPGRSSGGGHPPTVFRSSLVSRLGPRCSRSVAEVVWQ